MEWWLLLIVILGGLILLLVTGMPVAICFILINLVGVLILQGGGRPFHSVILSMYSSVNSFVLLPVPLFILMGEILWHSRIAFRAINVLDSLLGRTPGRLSILTVLSGTVFSSLSGSTMANTAVLGTMLLPDMEKRGYKRPMSIGPILASGGLAWVIPPSALAVILAAIAKLSIGRMLIAAMIPGLIMAVLYMAYIVVRCQDPARADAELPGRAGALARAHRGHRQAPAATWFHRISGHRRDHDRRCNADGSGGARLHRLDRVGRSVRIA